MNKDIYQNDLLHRFSGYEFVETTVGSMTKVEFLDDNAATVAEATALVVVDAYKNIRQQMLNGASVPVFISTEAERDALTGVDEATIILNDDSYAMECFGDGIWYPAVGTATWNVRPTQTLETDNDTPTEIDELDLEDEKVYMIQISVVGITADGSGRCGVIKTAVLYRHGGGVATIQGNVSTIIEEYSDSNWDVDITVNSNAVRATVTGFAATTINWDCSMQFIEQ